tara:strand:+ start:4054 stop:4164 length:111 start_codon:yes stop_codon:yes gene_type:complete
MRLKREKKTKRKGENMINYPCGWFDIEQLPWRPEEK